MVTSGSAGRAAPAGGSGTGAVVATGRAHDLAARGAAGVDVAPFRVLLYSDEAPTREAVRLAVGRRVARDLPVIEWTEVATAPTVLGEVEVGGYDLVILDGEARKVGGIGLCRQLRDEIHECPPVMLLLGRPQDVWLAASAAPDAAVTRPLDPVVVQETVAGLLRKARA